MRPGTCAPSLGSMSTWSRKSFSTTRLRRMSGVPDWITSRTPRPWTPYELGAILVAAGLGPAAEHALISLLALNGLRLSEAADADIEHLGPERGHRTLEITRKGGKVVTIPLAPRTARAIDLATGERTEGPLFRHRGRTAAGPARRRPGRPAGDPPRRDRQARQPVESARGAVLVLPPARFPGPLAEPAVPISR